MNIDLGLLKEKAKGYLKTAHAKALDAAAEARERTDRAAEAVAAKVTEVTGRATTASEVKRTAAVLAGAVVLGTEVLAVGSARRGVVGALPGTDAGGGSGVSFGNDFEDLAVQTFAEGGHSLNFYTPHVDSCGTIYSGPNG